MKLFQMRYRGRHFPESGYIEATSLEKAEELGRKWCEGKGVRLLKVEDAILVREEPVVEFEVRKKVG